MTVAFPPLPFAETDLEPHVSADTMRFHYGKHHRAYVDGLNKAIDGTDLSDRSLEEIVVATAGDGSKKKVFNSAAQAWNHDFFWHCIAPGGDSTPSGDLSAAIEKTFSDLDGFKQAFKQAATGQFGSGWAWLVLDKGELKITSTGNAETPIAQGQTALLTCDVWEHAYYLDYQNDRGRFLETFLDKLINWSFVAENFSRAS